MNCRKLDLKSDFEGGEIMVDSELLKECIKKSGLKYYFIAQKLGISRYTLQMKIDNETEFKISEALALAEMLNMSEKLMFRIFFGQELDLKSSFGAV